MLNLNLKWKVLLLISILSFYSISYFSQAGQATHTADTLEQKKKHNALVFEIGGKSWGATLSYERQITKKHSLGIGMGTSPVFSGGKVVGVAYGLYHTGKEKNKFVASAGLMFSKKILSPNIGLGYEYDGNIFCFRVMPYAILAMDNDYPVLPSLALHFGVKF